MHEGYEDRAVCRNTLNPDKSAAAKAGVSEEPATQEIACVAALLSGLGGLVDSPYHYLYTPLTCLLPSNFHPNGADKVRSKDLTASRPSRAFFFLEKH
jgi:hypothetical protein